MEGTLNALRSLAFSSQLDPTWLWRGAELVRNVHPEESEALAEYAGTFADILSLPTYDGHVRGE